MVLQVAERHGSISAEHGLGLAKKEFIGYSRSETMVKLMKQIKNFYDPVRQSTLHEPKVFADQARYAERDHEPVQIHIEHIPHDCLLVDVRS